MKKFLSFILFVALFATQLQAQTTLNTAVDFTATDCHGQQVKLFDILDSGKYVLIDFFFTTCGPCQASVPKIKAAYEHFGCNDHEVFFMEISPTDNNAQCLAWVNNFGIEYPTIGKDGGGNTICAQYGIPQYPTVILIKPDRSIVIKDLWPIPSAQTIIDALTPHGIQQHECGNTEPECLPATNVNATVDGTTVNVTWTAPATTKSREVILSEGFESGIPSTWTQIDADGDGFMWTITPAFQFDNVFSGHNSEKAASSASWDAASDQALNPNNYLITPNVSGATSVSFYVGSPAGPAYIAEHYAVMVSSTGTAAADFTVVFEETLTYVGTKADENGRGISRGDHAWTQKTVNLPEGTKYIAFGHFNCTDKYMLRIDDVVVLGGTPVSDFTYTVTRNNVEIATGLTETAYTDSNVAAGVYNYCVKVVYSDCVSEPACDMITGIEQHAIDGVRVYPNPASHILNIEGNVNSITMYNSFGQAVKAAMFNNQINVSSLTNGVYSLVIDTNDGRKVIEKVVIAR